jgi:hypothetical protein
MMKKQQPESLDSFDRESFIALFEKVIPQFITEMGDLLERPTPRVTRRNREQISNDMAWGLDVSLPQLSALETISKDPKRVDEGYRILEQLLRTLLRRAKFRLRPKEDAFDYFLRKSASLLRSPYAGAKSLAYSFFHWKRLGGLRIENARNTRLISHCYVLWNSNPHTALLPKLTFLALTTLGQSYCSVCGQHVANYSKSDNRFELNAKHCSGSEETGYGS